MRRFLLVLILLAVTVLPAAAQVKYTRGTLLLAQGARRVTLQLEVADTAETRSQGLMHRRSLPENAGMLFIFEQSGSWGFWMKNTLIPLSIAFIDDDWRIVDIVDMDVAPNPGKGPFKIYESARPFRYALEVNQGFFTRKGLGVGAKGTYKPATP